MTAQISDIGASLVHRAGLWHVSVDERQELHWLLRMTGIRRQKGALAILLPAPALRPGPTP